MVFDNGAKPALTGDIVDGTCRDPLSGAVVLECTIFILLLDVAINEFDKKKLLQLQPFIK